MIEKIKDAIAVGFVTLLAGAVISIVLRLAWTDPTAVAIVAGAVAFIALMIWSFDRCARRL